MLLSALHVHHGIQLNLKLQVLNHQKSRISSNSQQIPDDRKSNYSWVIMRMWQTH